MNIFYKFFKTSLLIVSTILLLLVSVAPATTHADTGTGYTMKYFYNGATQSSSYATYDLCNQAKQTWSQRNVNAQCIPNNGADQFYCWQAPVQVSNPNVYEKYCYLENEEECTSEIGNTPGAINNCSTAQSLDDSGLHGDITNVLPQAQVQTYQFLAPLKDANGQSFTNPDLVTYVKGMYRFIIALAGIIAVIMIIVGGLMYMSSDAISKKRTGKDIIIRTLWGILLLFGSYLILYTINPTLVQIQTPSIGTASGIPNVSSTGTGSTGSTGTTGGTTDGSGTSPTGPKTSWCFKPYAVGINTVPFPASQAQTCKSTQDTCMVAAQQYQSSNNGFYDVVAKKGIGSGTYCYPSNTGNYATSQWCADISVNGTSLGSDCTAGNAYTINSAALEKVREKIQGYKDGKYVSAGDSATVLTHADADSSAVDPSGDYEYYVDSNTNKVCISVQHSNGLGRVEDCSTSEGAGAIMGYTFDTHNQSICETTTVGYWNNRATTFTMGTGNGAAGTSGNFCQ